MAGDVIANKIQLGDSATASNNFHIVNNVDGSMSINRGNVGSPLGEVLSISGTETVQRIMQFAPQTATGTSVTFTGIPSWAKEITISFNGVSTNGTSQVIIQAGTSLGVESTGYLGNVATTNTTAIGNTALSSGFAISTTATATAANTAFGKLTLTQLSSSLYEGIGNIGFSNTAQISMVAGGKALSGILDRIRITTVNGTDTFDAGSINILVKG